MISKYHYYFRAPNGRVIKLRSIANPDRPFCEWLRQLALQKLYNKQTTYCSELHRKTNES